MNEFPQTLKRVTVWALVFTAIFLGFKLLENRRNQARIEVVSHAAGHTATVVLRRGADGHYHWPGTVGGVAVDFLVDTGASRTVISQRIADQAPTGGWPVIGPFRGMTANGEVNGNIVRADIALQGGLVLRNMPLAVLPRLGGDGLLGMDVLGRLPMRQADGTLELDLPAPR